TDPAEQRAFWRIREEGAGTATRLADGTEAWPGWEDAAVPPERLGGYLRGFDSLMKRHRHRGVVYGHFGEGCVHVRIDFDLFSGQGVARFRDFVTEAADLVLAHGGSLSGEHGDGRARAELLTRMYGDQGVGAFGEFKSIWDPDGRMNPGVIVRPDRIDENLRLLSVVREGKPRTAFSYPDDHDDFGQAIRRCVGVGKCVEHAPADVMCPSYAVTGEERHSTRGRAHLLFEMLRGEVVTGGWRSAEVRDALDLCLSCKGCRSDCPTGVDMATYKAEFLANHYAGRPRPATHYSLGWLPLWSRLASAAPGLVNAAGRTSAVSTVIKLLAGIAPQRRLPQYARTPFTRLRRPAVRGRPPVVLWPDTFNNYFTPEVAVAATRVLEHAGFDVLVPRGALCCGLTWISTGQLGVAARVLRRTLRILRPVLEADVAVVGLEPSCVSVFRSDLAELLPDEAIARRLARQTRTLPEFLQEYAPDWSPPRLSRRTITQTHCHQYAVLGSSADEAVLAKAGLDNQSLPAGCCGLAGDFGFQRGHYDIARAIGERTLLPAVRAAEPDTLVVADGFSCRTQIVQETDRAALHLAQVLAMAIGCP
ncbi:MAG: 4Fe-4S dicluster domain-containing protein, partial [Kutzneria sp.]|nr:4Fe-4S dicluster domain-containing protein [Kutzneria sp.]